jgi:TolB protein
MDRRNESGDDRNWGLVFAILLAVLPLVSSQAHALEVDLNKGRIDPIEIAIPSFAGDGEGAQVGADIAGVVASDLASSGYFAPIDPSSFLEQITSSDQQPNFDNWRPLKAQALVAGEADMSGGKISVKFRLWDVRSQQQLTAFSFSAGQKNWRRLGHKVADEIYKSLTGFDGYFDTRVVFVDESGPKDNRIKKLAIMDQDGFGVRNLTKGRDLVLTPRFSPTSQEITYMSFDGGNPRVYLMNIDTGQREIVGDFPNMSFSPRFSPDGQQVIMSLQDGGNSNIFAMDLRSRQLRQLTNTPAINTAPSFSPDAGQVAFESDRGGQQQIYVMGADGSNQQRVSFGDGRYSTPVWSPDGKWIAFTKQKGGKFSIGVMAPDGSGERILTEGFHNEGPTWSPNSRVIMFFRESGSGPQLYSVDVTGYNERKVRTPGLASDPAWSPLLN